MSAQLACTFLEMPFDEAGCDGEALPFEDVLHGDRLAAAPLPSRLPPQLGVRPLLVAVAFFRYKLMGSYFTPKTTSKRPKMI